MRGSVKWFSEEKGFGFINAGGREDYFVHYKDIVQNGGGRRNLETGQDVEFTPTDGKNGKLAAVDVKVVG